MYPNRQSGRKPEDGQHPEHRLLRPLLSLQRRPDGGTDGVPRCQSPAGGEGEADPDEGWAAGPGGKRSSPLEKTHKEAQKGLPALFWPIGGGAGPRPQRDGGEGGAHDKYAGRPADALRPAAGRARGHARQTQTPSHPAREEASAAAGGSSATGDIDDQRRRRRRRS